MHPPLKISCLRTLTSSITINMCGPADNPENILYCIFSRAAFFFDLFIAHGARFFNVITVVNVNESWITLVNVKGSHTNNNVKESWITLVNVKLKS